MTLLDIKNKAAKILKWYIFNVNYNYCGREEPISVIIADGFWMVLIWKQNSNRERTETKQGKFWTQTWWGNKFFGRPSFDWWGFFQWGCYWVVSTQSRQKISWLTRPSIPEILGSWQLESLVHFGLVQVQSVITAIGPHFHCALQN